MRLRRGLRVRLVARVVMIHDSIAVSKTQIGTWVFSTGWEAISNALTFAGQWAWTLLSTETLGISVQKQSLYTGSLLNDCFTYSRYSNRDYWIRLLRSYATYFLPDTQDLQITLCSGGTWSENQLTRDSYRLMGWDHVRVSYIHKLIWTWILLNGHEAISILLRGKFHHCLKQLLNFVYQREHRKPGILFKKSSHDPHSNMNSCRNDLQLKQSTTLETW